MQSQSVPQVETYNEDDEPYVDYSEDFWTSKQPNVLVSVLPDYKPVVDITTFEGLMGDTEYLATQILIGSFAAQMEYRALPPEVRAWDRSMFDKALEATKHAGGQ